MPRTVWTKLQFDPNGTWRRHEGEPPFSITALPEQAYDVLTDTGESFVITPLPAPVQPTLSLVQSGPNTLSITSSAAGTCYYGWYPDGTAASTITAAYMIAGTDTGQIAGGKAGFFVAAGDLEDVEIPFDGLVAMTPYTLAVLVDIDDSGSYTNVATADVMTPSDLVAPTVSVASTDVGGDSITLTMSEAVTGTGVPSEWAVNGVVAGAPTIDSVTVSGTTITLELSGNLVQTGETITVDHTAGDIQDSAGNALSSFTGQVVTNNVPAAGLTVSYLGEYTNTADVGGTTFTFSNINCGSGGEIYVVAQAWQRRANSITIDGMADNAPIRNNNSNVATSIGRATGVSSGNNTVVVEFEFAVAPAEGARIAVFEVAGKTSEVASHIHTNQAPPNDAVFNVLDGDVILGGAGEEGGGSPAVSNMTQQGSTYDYDSSDEGNFWQANIAADTASYTTSVTGGTRNSAAFVQLR